MNCFKVSARKLGYQKPTLFRDQFVTRWYRFFWKNVDEPEQKYRIGAGDTLSLFVMISFLIRTMVANFSSRSTMENPETLLRLGCFHHIIGVPAFRMETAFGIASMLQISLVLWSISGQITRRKLQWLAVVDSLESGSQKPIGLKRVENKRFQKQCRIQYRVATLACNQSILLMTSLFAYLYLTYYRWWQFLVYCLPWLVLSFLFIQDMTYSIYHLPVQCFSLKLIIKYKLRRQARRIGHYFDTELRAGRFGSIGPVLHSLSGILAELARYNQFWKSVITIMLFWRILIINFCAYLAFFVHFHELTIWFGMVCINETASMLFFVGQVATVRTQTATIRKQLIQGLARHGRQMPRWTKIKILNFAETFSTATGTGFSLLNNVTIQPLHLVVIVREMSQLFFLLILLSDASQSSSN